MPVVLQQTDDAPDFAAAAFCSGLGAGANAGAVIRATEGGTPGVATASVTVNATEADKRYLYFECDVPSGYDGAAGDITLEFNKTGYTGTGGLVLKSKHACRVNSAGVSQETLGSVTYAVDSETELSTPAAPHVYSETISQASPATFAEGDKVVIVLGLFNENPMTAQVLQLTKNATITLPGSVSVAASYRGKAGRMLADNFL